MIASIFESPPRHLSPLFEAEAMEDHVREIPPRQPVLTGDGSSEFVPPAPPDSAVDLASDLREASPMETTSLAANRPRSCEVNATPQRRTRPVATIAWVVGVPAVFTSLIVLWGVLLYKRPLALFAKLRGQVLLVKPAQVSLGEIAGGGKKTATFEITNLTSEVVTIVGAKMTCSCVSTEQMPIEIGPRETRKVQLDVYLPVVEKQELFEQTIQLRIDKDSPAVIVRVFAELQPDRAKPPAK